MEELSKEEKRAINALERIAKKWPKSLWLYSGSGSLCVMKKAEGNNRAMNENGGVCQEHIITTIKIENDGGDWDG